MPNCLSYSDGKNPWLSGNLFENMNTCGNKSHSNETAALKKHVTKYISMPKWMVKFLRKSKSRGDKIARVNSIRITKYINLL